MITAFNTSSETKIYIPCPNCRKPHEIGVAAFIVAINRESLRECVHCKETFIVELRCLTRAAQQRNEAEASGQICPRCEGAGQYCDLIGKRVCSLCNGTGQI